MKIIGMCGFVDAYNDQDYVDRKEYIVPLMKEGWPEHTVYELDPTKGSKDVHNYMKSINNLVS